MHYKNKRPFWKRKRGRFKFAEKALNWNCYGVPHQRGKQAERARYELSFDKP